MTSSTHLNGFKTSSSLSAHSGHFRRSASLSDFHSSSSKLDADHAPFDHHGGGGGGGGGGDGVGGPPLRGLPVVIVMAKGSELTEDKLEDLRQQGRDLALSLQSPFVDLPELEAMEEEMTARNGVSNIMGREREALRKVSGRLPPDRNENQG